MNTVENRPWGNYTILSGNDYSGYKVKRIEVNPLQRLSLQSHQFRTEYWTVVSGEGIVELNNNNIVVKKESTIQIQKQEKHRIQNTSTTEPLIFIEVQIGDYLGEDDIIRYEDDYKRE